MDGNDHGMGDVLEGACAGVGSEFLPFLSEMLTNLDNLTPEWYKGCRNTNEFIWIIYE